MTDPLRMALIIAIVAALGGEPRLTHCKSAATWKDGEARQAIRKLFRSTDRSFVPASA